MKLMSNERKDSLGPPDDVNGEKRGLQEKDIQILLSKHSNVRHDEVVQLLKVLDIQEINIPNTTCSEGLTKPRRG
jgi:hypothetical protein